MVQYSADGLGWAGWVASGSDVGCVMLYIDADIDVDIGNRTPMGTPTRVVVPSCFQGRNDSYHIKAP